MPMTMDDDDDDDDRSSTASSLPGSDDGNDGDDDGGSVAQHGRLQSPGSGGGTASPRRRGTGGRAGSGRDDEDGDADGNDDGDGDDGDGDDGDGDGDDDDEGNDGGGDGDGSGDDASRRIIGESVKIVRGDHSGERGFVKSMSSKGRFVIQLGNRTVLKRRYVRVRAVAADERRGRGCGQDVDVVDVDEVVVVLPYFLPHSREMLTSGGAGISSGEIAPSLASLRL